MVRACYLVFAAALSLGLAASAWGAESIAPTQLEFFEAKIRPVLAKHCYMCHSAEAKTRMGGLSLDTRDGVRTGGQRGHAVVPFDIESSLIVEALSYDGEVRMPPTGKLSAEVLQDFVEWIAMGAPDPREPTAKQAESTIDLEQGRGYWAFQAPVKASLPAVRDQEWPRGAIDQYILAGLEARGLRPVADANREDLLRRVSLDLTGLPPTADEIEAFLADASDGAFRAVVDRLLESEGFGERWGRHWLDVVRYADSIGRTRNLPFPVAWKYRDYVIRSFREDKPYDRFVREQIAGDLLPAATPEERIENQIATGFLALGAHDLNEPDAKQFEMDVADEMVNVATRSVLALSVGCARCHDHKFDPIPTADYYSLAGIFRNSELRNGLRRRPRFNAGYFRVQLLTELDGLPDYSSQDTATLRAERARLWGELQAAEKDRDRGRCRELAKQLGKLPLPGNLAMGVVEAKKRVQTRVNIGGDPHTLGDPVERGFLRALYPEGAELPRIGKRESGRLQLADWLTRRDNPLTSRVMANRVWHHLFGRGLVPTVDNFGKMGRPASHPELLDYLAVQFVERGWSIKSLIREIVLSRTYQMSGGFDPKNFEADPDNELLWRANLRRLEVEALRDSILQVSGELDHARPISPLNAFDRNQLINTGNRQIEPWEVRAAFRSVYLPVIRNQTNRLFESFDFPEPSETHGARDVTTGPSQALFLFNNDFVRTHASVAAERLLASHAEDRERVRRAFRQVLSRGPTSGEVESALRHIASAADEFRSAGPADGGEEAARAWLAALLEKVLERRPEAAEVSDAMDYMANQQPGAERSTQTVARAFEDTEGRLRGSVVRGLIERLRQRPPDRAERAAVTKYLRQWRKEADVETLLAADSGDPEHRAWTRFYHALYNAAEFRYRN